MKFISSSYDPDTGISTVVMQHLGVKFTGVAKVHPDEKTKSSKFAGCRYAEIRATIKALKYERNKLKSEFKIIKNYLSSCESYADFDIHNNEYYKPFYRQFKKRENKIVELNVAIAELEILVKNLIQTRAEKIAKIEEYKAKKDNL